MFTEVSDPLELAGGRDTHDVGAGTRTWASAKAARALRRLSHLFSPLSDLRSHRFIRLPFCNCACSFTTVWCDSGDLAKPIDLLP